MLKNLENLWIDKETDDWAKTLLNNSKKEN